MPLPTFAQLAADLVHELNNPVGGVIGMSQLLLDGDKLGPQERKDVETILGQGQRCRAIIQDLLLFQRPPELKKEAVDLSRVVHSTLDTMRQDFRQFGIEVMDECPPSLPSVIGDPGQLLQVVLRLLLNARRALAGQKVKRLVIQGEKNADHVALRLRYTGRGLSEEMQRHDPGWLVCGEILQAHAGLLSVSHEASLGTTFTMEVPAYG